MKIVHFVAGLGLDGTSKVVQDLCGSASGDIVVSYIVSLTGKNEPRPASEWISKAPVKSFDYQFQHDYSLRSYAKTILFFEKTRKAAADIIRFIRELNPDILHCHVQPRELVIAILAAENTKTKLVFTDHLLRFPLQNGLRIKERLLALLYQRIYRHFYLVSVALPIYEQHLKLNFVNPAIGCKLIENKVDTEFFVPVETQQRESLTFIYVARMNVLKDHKTLLQAWSKARPDNGHKLLLVGDGPELNELKDLSNSLGISASVHFVGSQTNILPILQSCDCGIFPSRKEGLPIALLEMMSCGLPVIVSDIPELVHLVTDGVHGLVFKSGDSDDLAEKITRVIEQPLSLSVMGANARSLTVKKYDNRTLGVEYATVYNELI